MNTIPDTVDHIDAEAPQPDGRAMSAAAPPPSPGSRRSALRLLGAGALGVAGTAVAAGLAGCTPGGGSTSATSAPSGNAAATPGSPGVPGAPGASGAQATPRVTGDLTQRVTGVEEGDTSAMAPDPSSNQAQSQEQAEQARRAQESQDGGGSSSDTSDAQPQEDGQGSQGGSQDTGSTGGTGGADNNSADNGGTGSQTAPEVYSHAPSEASISVTTDLAPGITLNTSPAWHLARRASIAATADIAADIERMGAEVWIDQQLTPESIDDSAAEAVIAGHYSWSRMPASELKGPTGDAVYRAAPTVTNAVLTRVRLSKRVLAESVVELLGDHIYVPIHGKAESFITGFDVLLRTHALGRYADLLHAALTDVALLQELDNVESTKDKPNENLGRELLELYTVGRDAYTEDDVKASTTILTGHGMDWETMSYTYRPEAHATGAVSLLGFSDPNSDPAAGPDLLKRYVEHLCAQPSTARRLATRIARRYIADEPSNAVVEHIAKAYLDNDTRIAPAVRAALTHSEFGASVGKKWRRPMEFIMTIARASHTQIGTPSGSVSSDDTWNTGAYGWLIQGAGHAPRMYATVDGYPDTASYWMSSSLMMHLWNAAQSAVHGDEKESGVNDWVSVLQISSGAKAMETAARISWHLTGYSWPDAHLESVAALLAGLPESGEPGSWTVTDKDLPHHTSQAVRLCFASPYGFLR